MSGFADDPKRAFVMEWSGGIGDVFYMMWVSDHYNNLETLNPGKYATVINRCRTPGLEEILKWHPKRDQIEVIDLSWHPNEVNSVEDRKALNIPKPLGHIPLTREPVFYPSPEDKTVLPELTAAPFIVFALSGSFNEKNVPVEVAEKIATVLIKKGYRVIQVGKSYRRRVCQFNAIGFNDREEVRLTPRTGVTDMIDRLTLPGTCELVRASAGVVCCDSSIMHLSLRMKKPTFIVVPDKWSEYWLSVDSASWGKSEPHGGYTKVSEYSDEKLTLWFSRNKLSGEIA
jgi:hypothetical protein